MSCSVETPFLCMVGATARWLIGARPRDHEPPKMTARRLRVDAVRWAYAGEAERKRMVREARG